MGKEIKVGGMGSTGVLVAGIGLCSNLVLSSMNMGVPNSIAMPLAGSLLVGSFAASMLNNNKYDKLFRMCGIENKEGKVPLIIKKTKKDTATTLVIHLPEGLSQKHFEQKQQELEQHFNAKIEFGFNKNLIMKLISMSLKTKYDYIFEKQEKPLEVYCGQTHSNKFILDIAKCPHILLAGETDSGKSSLLDVIATSLIINPHDINLRLIDFQAVTLGKYENCRKVKSYGETPSDFDSLMDELSEENERRIKLFRSVKNKHFIDKLSTWNDLYSGRTMPYIVVMVDEFSRLSEEEYKPILEKFRSRVSMDRKVGIHYIVSMQRPDVKCISGSIKANMPTRIAFKTVTDTDSEVILDTSGAEKLKNQGRFLAKYCGELTEVQALYIEPNDIKKLLKQYKVYKSREELEAEHQEQMKALREQCINPYLNGGR